MNDKPIDEQMREIIAKSGMTFTAPMVAAQSLGVKSEQKTFRTFDWDAAAKLIAERRPRRAEAGLAQDWGYTGGTIYKDGKPVTDDYTYLSSWWAIPSILMNGKEVPCWRWESEVAWRSDTKWPESALAILAALLAAN